MLTTWILGQLLFVVVVSSTGQNLDTKHRPLTRFRRDLDLDKLLQVVENGKFVADTWLKSIQANREDVFGVATDFMTCVNVICHPTQIIDAISENIFVISDMVETIRDTTELFQQFLSILKNLPVVGPIAKPVELVISNTVLPTFDQVLDSLQSVIPTLQKTNNFTDSIEDGCELIKKVVMAANGLAQLADSLHDSNVEQCFLKPIADQANVTCFNVLELLPSSEGLLNTLSRVRQMNLKLKNSVDSFSIYDVTDEIDLVKTLNSFTGPVEGIRSIFDKVQPVVDLMKDVKIKFNTPLCMSLENFFTALLDSSADRINCIISVFREIIEGNVGSALVELGKCYLPFGRKRRMVENDLNSLEDLETNVQTLLHRRMKRALGPSDIYDLLKQLIQYATSTGVCIIPQDILEGSSNLLDTVLAPFNDVITSLLSGATEIIKDKFTELTGLDLDMFTSFDSFLEKFTPGNALPSLDQFDGITDLIMQNELFQKASSLLEDNFALTCKEAILDYLDPDVDISITDLKCKCIKDCGTTGSRKRRQAASNKQCDDQPAKTNSPGKATAKTTDSPAKATAQTAGPTMKPPANTDPFIKVPNKDCKYNDISNFRADTASECTGKCGSNSNCVAAVYKSKPKWCWLKKKCLAEKYISAGGVDIYLRPADFTKVSNKDCKYNDISNFGAATSSVCVNRCRTTDNCVAVVYKPQPKWCWLKKKCLKTDYISVAGVYIYIRPANFRRIPNKDCKYNDITNFKSATASNCVEACRLEVNCVAAVYKPAPKLCWLKNKCQKSDYISVQGMDIYIKPGTASEAQIPSSDSVKPTKVACVTKDWAGTCTSARKCKKSSKVRCPGMSCGRKKFCCFAKNDKPPKAICNKRKKLANPGGTTIAPAPLPRSKNQFNIEVADKNRYYTLILAK